jgi:NAD(P)-dependent dehydrogenase (short-subunit alcohol dehydrogenase family)
MSGIHLTIQQQVISYRRYGDYLTTLWLLLPAFASWNARTAASAKANALRREIETSGGQAHIVCADLASSDGATRLAEQVCKIVDDKLDILVVNAGISKAAPIESHIVEEFDSLFATNVPSAFLSRPTATRPAW